MVKATMAARWLPQDFLEASQTGGVFTIVAYVAMVIVLAGEFRSFFDGNFSTEMYLDRHDAELLQINFDIDVHDIECRNLKVTVYAQAGEENLNMASKDFVLRAVDSKGRTYGMAIKPDEEPEEDHGKRMQQLKEADGNDELDSDWASSHDGFKHKSFEHVIEGHDFTLINFFAEWCSHCRNFSPRWNDMAKKINGADGQPPMQFPDRDNINRGVRLIKMNCVDFQSVCHEKGIDAYPTMRLYKADGSFSVYEGKREEADVMRWTERTVKMKSYGWAKHHDAFERGCNVKGRFQVPRVPGHFELMAGGGDQNLNVKMTNVSHYVRHLSFADPDDGKTHQRHWRGLPSTVQDHIKPMDGTSFDTFNFHEAWIHDLKVVSTISSKGYAAYQFSHQHRLSLVPSNTIPQAQFHWDVEPFSIIVKQDSKRWYDFATSLFAVIGGIYALMRLISSGALNAFQFLRKYIAGSIRSGGAMNIGHFE